MTAYDPTLPAGSTLGKSYEYGVDVDTGAGGLADAIWQAVRRIFNVLPTMTPVTQDAQTYDDLGSPNADVSAWSWTLAWSVYVNRANGTLPAELLALQARFGDKKGEAAKIRVRWYHKPSDGTTPDPAEAFEGVGTVAIVRGNIDPTGLNEMWNVTITGTGYAVRIPNPFEGWAGDDDPPVVTTVGPVGQSVSEQVVIGGSGFTGVTGVTIDGEAAEFVLIGPSALAAIIPATAAGPAPVVVTNAAGSSAPFEYTVA